MVGRRSERRKCQVNWYARTKEMKERTKVVWYSGYALNEGMKRKPALYPVINRSKREFPASWLSLSVSFGASGFPLVPRATRARENKQVSEFQVTLLTG
jgi:hypothetical protein